MFWKDIVLILYVVTLVGLAVYGFNALVMSFLYLKYRRQPTQTVAPPETWPTVTVQLPIYNERYVVERLIDAVAALDYPLEALSIQVLDDSTDDTSALARARVAYYRREGLNIEWIRRPQRHGFKAGALAYGLQEAPGQFVAVFDADFVPHPNFLKQVIPHFTANVGMIQARWGHLNAAFSPFTRAQALALDGHFVVEQTVRSRAGLMMNFNGSGGVWRKACIIDAGGWQDQTVAEDLDLSYRAQLAGWQLNYLPDVVAPAEIPAILTAYKRQQFRWAKGSVQALKLFAWRLLTAPYSIWKKGQAFLHLSGYLVHPLMLLMILLSLPAMLWRDLGSLPLGALGIAGLAPPILFAISQWALYADWKQRLLYLPFLILTGAGMTLNNSWAIVEGVTGRNAKEFLRTPKYQAEGRRSGTLHRANHYNLPIDWTTWGELFFAFYSTFAAVMAWQYAPGLSPFLFMYAAGFFYLAGMGVWQSQIRFPSANRNRKQRKTLLWE